MIEAGVNKQNKQIGQLKDDYVYILNYQKDIFKEKRL